MNVKHNVRLRDCEVSYFSGTGAGGQHRNKHMNCVRLYHAPSGVRVMSQDHREKPRNELEAMRRLAAHPKFRFWAQEELKRLEGQETIAQAVEQSMQPENLLVTDLAGNPL